MIKFIAVDDTQQFVNPSLVTNVQVTENMALISVMDNRRPITISLDNKINQENILLLVRNNIDLQDQCILLYKENEIGY